MSVLYVHVLCTVGFLLINRFCNIQRGKLKASDPEIETLWNFPSTHTLGLPTCVEFHSIIPFLQLNFLPFRFTNPAVHIEEEKKKVSEKALHLHANRHRAVRAESISFSQTAQKNSQHTYY